MNKIYQKIKFVIFLLLTGCATGETLINQGEIYQGMSKNSLRDRMLTTYPGDDPFLYGSFSNFNYSKGTEIIAGFSKKVFYVFEDVNKPVKCGIIICDYGNGRLVSWHYSLQSANQSLIEEKKPVQKKQPKLVVSTNNEEEKTDYIRELNNLIEDLENGKITKEEFNRKKVELLN